MRKERILILQNKTIPFIWEASKTKKDIAVERLVNVQNRTLQKHSELIQALTAENQMLDDLLETETYFDDTVC